MATEWTTYRTRFLIKAKQLETPLTFVDALGREHTGQKGDYLVQSSDGSQRIAPREIFEDIYVPISHAGETWPTLARANVTARTPSPPFRRRASPGGAFVA